MNHSILQGMILPEQALGGEFLVATYLLSDLTGDILKTAAAMAAEQTTGTWVSVPGIDQQSVAEHAGRVMSIWEVPDHETSRGGTAQPAQYVVQLAFPVRNFQPQIPMLLTTVFGNISLIGDVKLLDIIFPKRFTDSLPGPRFGIPGVREALGVPDRPLLNTMIKPSIGLSPDQGAELLYQAAIGGADIIKDDEVLADPEVSPTLRRVDRYMRRLRQAERETGEKKLYAVNLTGEAETCLRNAEKVVAEGANAVMINYLTAGFGVVSSLARNPAVGVPILAHLDFGGALCAGPKNGVSSTLLYGKLARLAGVDLLTIPSPYGKFDLSYRSYSRIVVGLRDTLHGARPVFPIIGGAIKPGTLAVLLSFLGRDFIIGAGGAVYGHPFGAAGGAKAFRQGISQLLAGKSLEEADQAELAAAIDRWGIDR